MVNNIADLSEMDTGVAKIQSAPINLTDMRHDLLDFFDTAAKDKHIETSLHAQGPVVAKGDRNRLRMAFANVLDNAIKYTEPGGRIEVVIRAGAHDIAVSVTDTGIGIPADALPRVFDRFYRADGSRSSRGHGLGLSLASAIVKLHGGNIHVRSSEGKGSIFTITLPRPSPDSLPSLADTPDGIEFGF